MISRNLAKHPNKTFNITDSSQAKMLLLEIGILDQFPSNGPPSGWNKEWVTSVGYSDHPTHWIVGFQYIGFAADNDNGFGSICLPKTDFTSAQVEEQLRKTLLQNATGPLFEKLVPNSKINN